MRLFTRTERFCAMLNVKYFTLLIDFYTTRQILIFNNRWLLFRTGQYSVTHNSCLD